MPEIHPDPTSTDIVPDPCATGRFSGIRVIPDVHGAFEAFDRALDEAARDGHYVLQLGDLIDRGPYSAFCVERMLEIEDRGVSRMILGNHETAFERFVSSRSGGSAVREQTLMEFDDWGGGLLDRFLTRIRRGGYWARLPGLLAVHAAFHPRMADADGTRPDEELARTATDGIGATTEERRASNKARRWVDTVPTGTTVVVGHQVTESRAPEITVGRRGGTAVFCDTGSWLDGSDLPKVVFARSDEDGLYRRVEI